MYSAHGTGHDFVSLLVTAAIADEARLLEGSPIKLRDGAAWVASSSTAIYPLGEITQLAGNPADWARQCLSFPFQAGALTAAKRSIPAWPRFKLGAQGATGTRIVVFVAGPSRVLAGKTLDQRRRAVVTTSWRWANAFA